MSSLKVDNQSVCNSIFIILSDFMSSSKGRILSNDSRSVKFVIQYVEVFGVGWCKV